MKHRLPKLPGRMLIAGVAAAAAIHVALLLGLGVVYGAAAGVLGVAVFIVAVKRIAFARAKRSQVHVRKKGAGGDF